MKEVSIIGVDLAKSPLNCRSDAVIDSSLYSVRQGGSVAWTRWQWKTTMMACDEPLCRLVDHSKPRRAWAAASNPPVSARGRCALDEVQECRPDFLWQRKICLKKSMTLAEPLQGHKS